MSSPRRALLVVVAVISFGAGLFLGIRDPAAPATTHAGDVAPGQPRTHRVDTVSSGAAVGRETVRGIYVVRHSLRNADSIDAVIEQAVRVGANAVFVQVNGRSEAYYSSDVVVPAPDVAPGFDPLAYVLQTARPHGLRVHAWINAYTAGMLLDTPVHDDHILNRRPDWVTVDRTGRSLWDYSWQEAQVHVPARMLDPGVPDVAQFVLRSVLEVVDKYDVDGVHIDYIRYPSRRFGFHPASVASFEVEHGFDPLALEREAPAFVARHGRPEFERQTALWDEWRGQQVTDLVTRLREGIKARGPEVAFTVAVVADARAAVAEHLQNWPAWIADGLVDAVVPMAYSPDGERVRGQIDTAVGFARPSGVSVYAGIGAYMLADDPGAVSSQMAAVMAAGASGTIMFSHDTLLENGAVARAVTESWGRSD